MRSTTAFIALPPRRAVGAALLWALLATALPAHAQQPPPPSTPPAATPGAELVTINMRDADIRAVIQWIAEQTRRQIVVDPRVQGKVTVLADRPMTVDQAYQVFLALLEVHGYSSSDTGGVLRIFPSALAKTSPKAVVDDFARFAGGGEVMHVTTVRNVSAATLAETLKPLLGPTGYIAPLAASNSLVMADTSGNVQRLLELIQRMDRSGSLDIDVVKLQHASARDAAQVLGSLVAPAGAAGGETPLSVAADERSNAVLLAGDPVNRQRARQLLKQMDQPLARAGATRVIYLHYQDAEELVPVLKGMTGSVQKDAKEETVRQAQVSIEASKSTNALVLSGPPDLLDDMEQVIAKLDIRRAQVLVEAVIVELSQELGSRLGVEWNTSLNGNGLEAATRFGVQPPVPDDIDEDVPEVLSLLTNGLTLGYFRHGSLRALVNALASTSEANILSTPSVMTLDNQEAQILVGSNIPIVTGQSTGQASSTENPFTTIERQDIGVTLKITPQINVDDAITLDILQEVETVADATTAGVSDARDIVTNKRSLSTKVLVKDDRMLVLGGLISDENQELVSKVPVLGDMPLVGKLFRSTNKRTVKRNLMVFIRPVIIDSEEVAAEITRNAYDGMRSKQLKYQGGKFETAAPEALPEFEEFRPGVLPPAEATPAAATTPPSATQLAPAPR